ncbi:NAD-dependent epimerase/dehydratase family protein [Oceanobacter mangrovi]|uniref:NAD-dependent epimerase/dehydratase family protein n=1 Tax=Oceanobacter mangrovi TaxID=2862510 RepID=UPI001C8DE2DA|nr:NAD-dependent epimerase/dehydratase family protein [Oceanobacter mangrovi]
MKVLVTGGNGFVGRRLVERLLQDDCLLAGEPVTALTVADMSCAGLPADERLRCVEGSIADTEVLQQAVADEPQIVFHLASIPGGAAEKNFQLGLDVNLTATVNLYEACRQFAVPARMVFTSTIAVYGSPMPDVVDDQSALQPHISYGYQKLATELLLQDYSRRGFIDGRIVRLPGIVARPPQPSGLLSAFMSDMFWQLKAGEPFVCPVSEEGVAWYMSVPCCVENLIHAANISPGAIAPRRDFTLPVLRLTMRQVIDGLAQRYGEDRQQLVSFEPNPQLQAGFASQPPLVADAALAIGFRHDGDIQTLIERATSL